MAARAGDPDSARQLLEESIELHEQEGDTHAAARVMSKLSAVDAFTGRRDEALARMERAFAVISADEPDEAFALLVARLAVGHWFSGDLERAAERSELALDIAEAHAYPQPLAIALRAKAAVAESRGHAQEAEGLQKQSLAIALAHDLAEDTMTTYFILSDQCFRRDNYIEALGYLDEALTLSRKRGHRPYEWAVLAEMTYAHSMLGRWDEALSVGADFTQEQIDAGGVVLSLLQTGVDIHIQRGQLDEARRVFSMFSRLDGSTDVQDRSIFLASRAALQRAEGRSQEALTDGEATFETARTLGIAFQAVKWGIVEALEAALVLGDSAKVDELLTSIESVPPGSRPPYLDAQARRFRARLASDPAGFRAAAARFRELEIPFWLGVTLLQAGEEPGLTEAREIFERLGATPWLERVSAAASEARLHVRA
jgi:tetratricopeptide (TPR) repeat protein